MLVLGDLNIDLLENNNSLEIYKNIVFSSGFVILNKIHTDFFTRLNPQSHRKSILDHVVSNIVNKPYQLSINDCFISDHQLIMLSVDVKNKSSNRSCSLTKTVLQYEKIDNKNFEHDINKTRSFDELTNKCNTYIKKYTKIIRKTKRDTVEPWISNTLKKIAKTRDKFYKLYRKFSQNTFFKSQFIKYKNVLLMRRKKLILHFIKTN